MAQNDQHNFLGLPVWKWGVLSDVVSVVGVLGVLCAVLGVLFGVKQYNAQLEAQRAEKTLEMVDRWIKDEYRDSFVALREATVSAQQAVTTTLTSTATGQDPETVRAGIVDLVLSEPQDAEHLDHVVYYFNYLGHCVEAEVCSAEAARTFFDDTLLNFLSFYEAEIDSRRERDGGYAEGLILLRDVFRR